MVATLSTDALEALLVFYRDAGVDVGLLDAAPNRFEEQPVRRPPPEVPSLGPSAPVRVRPVPITAAGAPPAPDIAAQVASELARAAEDLDALKAAMEAFEGCALKATASRLVFEDGARGARIMFVGEAPGREEDLEGRPFVGHSGQLLDKMMAAIGLDRTMAYIGNIIPWRPPGNRTPTPQEIRICEPFIRRQIELAAPELLVCVGAPAMQTLMDAREGIMRARGKATTYRAGSREIACLAILHPAYLLRSPIAKRLAWRDMLMIKAILHREA